MKKPIFIFFIVLWLCMISYGDILEQDVCLDGPGSLQSYCEQIIGQTGVSIILEGDLLHAPKFDAPSPGKLPDVLSALCGKEYQWKLDKTVLIIQHSNRESPIRAYGIKLNGLKAENPGHGFDLFLNGLWQYRLLSYGIRAKSLNYTQSDQKDQSLFSYLCDLLQNQRALCWIYQIDEKSSMKLYNALKTNPNYDFQRVKDPQLPFWGIVIFPNQEMREERYAGKAVADGAAQMECKLSLTPGGMFCLRIKNLSKDTFYFRNFKKDGLIISNLACDNEWMRYPRSYLLYPPMDSDLPESFELPAEEERVFEFPLRGCRFRSNKGKPVWYRESEKGYDYSPGDHAETLPEPILKYNLYCPVVYFQDENGKRYKTSGRDFTGNI
ncbi:MAG: hypothetical protein HPZ91_01010 [Lentisphaeria bacterium]|nr:hypothetical protein [Lentisphaeria bacterium]